MPTWQVFKATARGSSGAPNSDRCRVEAANGYLLIAMADGAYRAGKRDHAGEGAEVAVEAAYEVLHRWAKVQDGGKADDPSLDDATRSILTELLRESIEKGSGAIAQAAATGGRDPAAFGTTLGVGIFWRGRGACRVVGDISFLGRTEEKWRLMHPILKMGPMTNLKARNATNLLPHRVNPLFSYASFAQLVDDGSVFAATDSFVPGLFIDENPEAQFARYVPNQDAVASFESGFAASLASGRASEWITETVERTAAETRDDSTLIAARAV